VQALPPEMFMQIMSLLIKLKNLGPIGDQITEILDPKDQDGQQVDPKQALALLKHAEQQIIPALQQQIEQLKREKESKVVETQGKVAVTEKQNEGRTQIEMIKAASAEGEAKLQADTALEVQQMRSDIEELKLLVQTQIEGARLEQNTAMQERGRVSADRHADANRASSERNAGADRALKGSTAALAAKQKAAKPAKERQ
jgi:hypothetical protein